MMNAADMNAYYTAAKVAELQTAFNRVAPLENWKLRIDTVISIDTPAEMEVIKEAVVFYTGSVASFQCIGRVCRVTAAGYYSAIGA